MVEREITQKISLYVMALRVLLFCDGLIPYQDQIDKVIDDL